MAHPENKAETTTKDRPATPASRSWTAPFATRETQVSNTMLDATGSEPVITTAVTGSADRASDTLTEEDRCRQLVRDLYRSREGRTLLDFLLRESSDTVEAVATQAMVSLVRRGEFGPDAFVSPDAYREFCQKHGIATPAEQDESIVTWIRERFPDAPEDPAEWDGYPVAEGRTPAAQASVTVSGGTADGVAETEAVSRG